MKTDSRDTKIILWVNRAIRWGMGGLLISYGIWHTDESRWIGFVLGTAFIITGFIRPKRCLQDNCSIN